MKDNAVVHVKFADLWIAITRNVPGNFVWNSWIIASVKNVDPCSLCIDSRVSPGNGTTGPTQFNHQWKRFDFEGDTRTGEKPPSTSSWTSAKTVRIW
jgi:hypothetical protein